MLSQRLIEALVGVFLTCAVLALTVLAFKVSGLTEFFPEKTYVISAAFDEIGGLKTRSPVKIGGVQIGEVTQITLDPTSYKAIVKLRINSRFKDIPDDSSAGILTSGLLGDNYVAINPMYNTAYLKNGDQIQFTHSAMVLEKLIGQFIYKMNNGGSKTEAGENTKTGDNYAS